MTVREHRGRAAYGGEAAFTGRGLPEIAPLTSINVNLSRMVILRGMSRLIVLPMLMLSASLSGIAIAHGDPA